MTILPVEGLLVVLFSYGTLPVIKTDSGTVNIHWLASQPIVFKLYDRQTNQNLNPGKRGSIRIFNHLIGQSDHGNRQTDQYPKIADIRSVQEGGGNQITNKRCLQGTDPGRPRFTQSR